QEEIVGGNGLVEMGTFLAILVGTLLGGYLIAEGSATPVAVTVVALAALGYLTSRWIPRSPAAAPELTINWNPFSETWRILWFMRGNRTVFLSVLGIIGGFYIVPVYTPIQTRTEARHRSRVIAGNNVLNALFVVCAAVLAIVLLDRGLSIPQLFLAAALLNAAVAIYIYTLVPEFLMRFLIWLLVHTVYRLDKSGLEHIPES